MCTFSINAGPAVQVHIFDIFGLNGIYLQGKFTELLVLFTGSIWSTQYITKVICMMFCHLISTTRPSDRSLENKKGFFSKHLLPWAPCIHCLPAIPKHYNRTLQRNESIIGALKSKSKYVTYPWSTALKLKIVRTDLEKSQR